MNNYINSLINNYNQYNNLKIKDMIFNNNYKNQSGGGELNNLIMSIKIIIGITLLIIGIIFLNTKNSFVPLVANVINNNCINKCVDECKITISYTVNNIEYQKIISRPNENNFNGNTINIYYDENNPNIIKLYGLDHFIIGIIIIFISLFFFKY